LAKLQAQRTADVLLTHPPDPGGSGEEDEMHTPGPWEFAGKNTRGIFGNDGHQVSTMYCKPLAFPSDISEMQANASLVAAAPELLEACKTVLDIINPYSHIKPLFDANLLLQAAIAKAEGRS